MILVDPAASSFLSLLAERVLDVPVFLLTGSRTLVPIYWKVAVDRSRLILGPRRWCAVGFFAAALI